MAKNIEDIYPLAPIQQGLLYEQMYRPGTGVYIEQLLISFTGALNPHVFEQAWQHVVDRHPILRTTFHWQKDGKVLQVVHREARLHLEVLDWRSVGEEAQEARLRERLEAERKAGFPLDQAPLMRATVVRRGEQEWTFAWRFSHLLMDGWSFGLAIEEFAESYRALVRGRAPDLVPAPPYRKYLAWWAGHDPDEYADYWKAELDGFTPPEPLSLGGEQLPEGTATHEFLELHLGSLGPGLRELTRRHQLTMNTVVQGAWTVLLSRYYGRDDIVCGATIAHRPTDLPGAQSILGPMIVTLPVREHLEPTRAVLPWLQDFQRHLATVRERTSLPLVEVQRAAVGSVEVPLFESSVSFENVPLPDLDLAEVGLKLTGMFYDGRPHYPITMVIMPGDELPLRIIYDRRKFSRPAATRIAEQLQGLLEQIVSSPELTLGELELGGDAAMPEEPAPMTGAAETLAASFESWVARTPDATAVVCDRSRLTYAELNATAEKIADRLRGLGTGPGDRVGLLLDRSAELIAAIIGVFKAGAAYVPLDPTHPTARLAELIEDSGAATVVAAQDLADRLPASAAEAVLLDPAGLPLPGGPAGRGRASDTTAIATDPAYVLYTSGSTGRPKAVVVTHANVQSLLAAARQEFGFGAEETWTFAHSFVFDYSVWETWNALANGATLVVVPHWTARSPHELCQLAADEGVTVLSLTPAVFEQVSAAVVQGRATQMPELKHIFLGGDRLDAAIVHPWIERYGDSEPALHNLYGLTEAAVVSTHHRITAADCRSAEPIPIGRALPNQLVRVLDRQQRRVPLGAVGEMYVAGPAVAAGYHGRDELTAERFGTDPLEPELRVYRTGDLVRSRDDGTLEFLGRADAQIKLRGFRIEPGEIEAVLRRHPAVRSAAVTVRRLGADAYLAAYLILRDGQVPVDSVRDWAASRLPAHMVPSALGRVETLPLNSSGKLDLAALPDLTPADDSAPSAYDPPRTPFERQAATYLEQLLGLERIGRRDRLTDLGLHSLHAMRLVTWLDTTFGAAPSLRELMAAPTIEALALVVPSEGSD